MFKPVWRVASAFALIAAVGCGGDDGTEPEGSISVTASPSALTVQQGGTGTVTVTLTRGGGFADPVNVTVEGLPAGVTTTVSPASLTGTTTSAVVTVNVASTVAAGSYPATIRASATGVGAATAQYTLTVTGTPNYTLSATPATVSIGQGGSGTTSIGIARTNFTDAVALTLVSPPTGITGSFNPASATGAASTLTINVAASVAQGNYTLTVQGAATGPGTKTTTVAVTVGPPPDFTLSTTPSTLTLAAGTNATTTVNINRTNFTGAVTLALQNPPQGITATFNPAAPTGTSSVATINVATTVLPGSFNVIIQGTATLASIEDADGQEALPQGGTVTRTTTVAVTVTTAASFTMSATPNALTIAPGASGTSSVAIVRTNFTTDVALSLSSPPQGITATFAPTSLTGTVLASTATINVPASAAAGTYPVTVQGVGGTLTQSTTINITVPAPTVGFTASPASLSIQQGASGTTTLNIARTAFTTGITPTVTGNPAGMTVTFNPAAPITANSSTVTIAVGSGVAAATYNVVIAAAGVPGNPTVTVPVTVTTTGGGGNIVYEFCSTDAPLKFWRKSSGAWQEVTGTVVGTVTRFSFSLAGNDAGWAFTAGSGSAFNTQVTLGVSSDFAGTIGTCTTNPTLVSKTFNVTNLGLTEAAQLQYGPGAAFIFSFQPSANVMVPAGTYDWMAAFGDPQTMAPATNYRIGRGEAAPGAAVTIDRTGAPAFVSVPFTVTGGTAGSSNAFIQGRSGARGSFFSAFQQATGNTGNLLYPQTGDRLGTDMHSLQILNTEGTSVSLARITQQFLGSNPPSTTTFALPAVVPTFTVTQPGGLWQAVGAIAAEFQTQQSVVSATFAGSNGSVIYSISASRNWLVANGMSTNYTLAQQNLPGFLPQWTPPAPLTTASVLQGTINQGTSTPVAGNSFNFSSRTLTPP